MHEISGLKLFRHWQDRKHELAILDQRMELPKLGHTQRLEEIEVRADIAESQALYRHDARADVKWVDALRGTVRPVITHSFFLLFTGVKASAVYVLITVEGMLIAEALPPAVEAPPGQVTRCATSRQRALIS